MIDQGRSAAEVYCHKSMVECRPVAVVNEIVRYSRREEKGTSSVRSDWETNRVRRRWNAQKWSGGSIDSRNAGSKQEVVGLSTRDNGDDGGGWDGLKRGIERRLGEGW